MVPQRIFWFGIEGKIRRGLLKVPKNIEYFQNGIYILKKEDMGGYRYISVYPEESWNTSTTISSQQPNLERLVKDDSIGDVLKLPEDSLLYLNLKALRGYSQFQ